MCRLVKQLQLMISFIHCTRYSTFLILGTQRKKNYKRCVQFIIHSVSDATSLYSLEMACPHVILTYTENLLQNGNWHIYPWFYSTAEWKSVRVFSSETSIICLLIMTSHAVYNRNFLDHSHLGFLAIYVKYHHDVAGLYYMCPELGFSF